MLEFNLRTEEVVCRYNLDLFLFKIYHVLSYISHILVNTIFLRRNDHNVLFVIHLEEFWLSKQWIFKFINSVNSSIIIIQLDDSILFYENQTVWFDVFSCYFKVELHAHFVHHSDFFDNDSFVEIEVGSFNTFENEELIGFLFLHDKIFSTNDS